MDPPNRLPTTSNGIPSVDRSRRWILSIYFKPLQPVPDDEDH